MTLITESSASLAADYDSPYLMDRIERRLMWAETWICAWSLITMSVSVMVSVIIRYAGIRIANYGELALVCMAPLTFVGAALCYVRGTHISVDILRAVKNRVFNKLLNFTVIVLCLAFAGIFFYFGGQFFFEFVDSGEIMMDVKTPLYLPAFFLPLGMLLLAFHAVMDLVRLFFPDRSTFSQREAS